jgi:hypothetical protein
VRALMLQAIDSSMRTGLDAKRRLLAAALKDAVQNEDKIDKSWVLAEVLKEVDVPHVHALQRPCGGHEAVEGEWDATEYHREWNALPAPVQGTLIRTRLANETSVLFGFFKKSMFAVSLNTGGFYWSALNGTVSFCRGDLDTPPAALLSAIAPWLAAPPLGR